MTPEQAIETLRKTLPEFHELIHDEVWGGFKEYETQLQESLDAVSVLADALAEREQLIAQITTGRASERELRAEWVAAVAERDKLRAGLSEVRLRHMYSEKDAGEMMAVWVLNGNDPADFDPRDEPYKSSEARYRERMKIVDAGRAALGSAAPAREPQG